MTTLNVKPKNKKELLMVEKILDALKVKFTSVEEESVPYESEFVNRILDKRENGNFTTIDTADIWGSLGFK